MLVDVDLSDMEALTRAAVADLKQLPWMMRAAVQTAAEYELRTKTYENQSGRQRAATKGKLESRRLSEVVVVLQADTDYASYLVRARSKVRKDGGRYRGWSNMDKAKVVAEKNLNAVMSLYDNWTG